MPPQFWLGTHMPNWLGQVDVPLFVAHPRIVQRCRAHLPRASAPWALDSGGFTQLSNPPHRWTFTPSEYVAAVRRYRDEIGLLQWAAPMDHMCEPQVLASTGATVAAHQRRTVRNYLTLRELAPELPFVPVVQGWTTEDYLRCADLYEQAGVDLAAQPLVGVGTVCRRQDTTVAAHVVAALAGRGYRLHGFGVKLTGLRVYGAALASSDSMAWSYRGRRAAQERPCPEGRSSCANCLHHALTWRGQALAAFGAATWQPDLFSTG